MPMSQAQAAEYNELIVKQGHLARSMKYAATIGIATGGAIYGPGTGTSDSIPAMLSNGELFSAKLWQTTKSI